MNPLLIYMIKAGIYLAALYIVYSLLLSRDTLYVRNRVFILISVVASLLLPVITIKTKTPVGIPFFGKTLSDVWINGSGTGNATSQLPDKGSILLLIYFTGSVIAGAKLLADLTGIIMLIAKHRKKGSEIIMFDGINSPAFTAFGHIFINSKLSSEEAHEIIRHEQNHLDNCHFLDIILIEIIKVLQWFNPFIYLFNKSLRAVHEYQADEGCIRKGIPVVSYQQLIMNQVLQTRLFTFSNSFSNPTLVKKRMIMMTKERSGMLANLKLLMVLPAVALVMVAFSSCGEKAKLQESKTQQVNSSQTGPQTTAEGEKKVELGVPVAPGETPPPPPPPPAFEVKNGDTTWVSVDKLPEFNGGDQAILQYIASNTVYPEKAKKAGIYGKVIVNFIVTETGSIKNVKVVKGVDPLLNAEAVRVVSTLPAFEKPGMIKGRPVSVYYAIPINFALK